MELLLTVEVPESGLRAEVSADLDPFVPVEALGQALAEWAAERRAAPPERPLLAVQSPGGGHRILEPGLPVIDAAVVSGHTVLLVDPAQRYRYAGTGNADGPGRPASVSLDVTTGPDAGRSVELAVGRHRVGRAPEGEVVLRDPAVSWAHCSIVVSPDLEVTVEPYPDARNGTFVSAEVVEAPRRLAPEETLVLGGTQMVLREALFETIGRRDWLGQVTFNPLPYRRPVIRDRHLPEIPRPPDRPGERRFPVLATLVPIVAAVVIVYLTKQPVFITVALLSPLMIVSNYLSEGRSSRRNYGRDRAEFERRVGARVAEIAVAAEEERRERLQAAPDVGFLGRQAAGRLDRLWERPRFSPDFLELRLGLGDRPSHIATPVEPGGHAELREWAEAELAHHRTLPLVPVTVALDQLVVAGLFGPADGVRELAASLLVQAACLHSPEQLVVAAAVPETEKAEWSWLKWLPHTRSATSPLEGAHLVDGADADDLIRRLASVLVARAEAEPAPAVSWPRVLVVVHERAQVDRAALAALLDSAPGGGVVCLWLGESRSELPRQCQAIVGLGPAGEAARISFTDPGEDGQQFVPEGVSAEVAERIARSLAPVRDVSAATVTTGIPRLVKLSDLPGLGRLDPSAMATRWATPRPYGLEAVLGLGVDGPFGVDLVGEGPHVLIAGTSGAGKSELLQTFVCSLGSAYPAERLTFLFIDYKGGASSAAFEELPHTVGQVTNLDERMARRALVSLRAELQRRMAILEGRAKDLAEMMAVAPEEAPPSLVIVVDEFATLVREIPDFVAGMVDVAQRGRSLGIHLVLATQRPAGSVNDNILANTNLRIALRVLDRADSTSVIGTKDAAAIPVPLRGRAYARTGPASLVPFQCAWAGAPAGAAADESRVVLRPFPFGASVGPVPVLAGSPAPAETAPERGPTQLEAFVVAAAEAHAGSGRAEARRPWVEPLPESVTRCALPVPDAEARRADPGRWVTIGLGDFPELQRQDVVSVDLEAQGGLIVFGSGGSGKTTLLRTVAADLAAQGTPDEVRMFVLDFGGRSLMHLEELPHVVSVATGDDLEKTTRMLTVLRDELGRRRRILSEARVDSVSDLRAQGGAPSGLPRLVVLLDAYAGFHSTFENGPLYAWIEQLVHLVTEGRQVGIHVILTNNRALGVPTAVTSAVAARLVMRMATADEMIGLGVARQAAVGAELVAGRCFLGAATEVQVALVSEDPSGAAQAASVSALADRLRSSGATDVAGLQSLPEVVKLSATRPEPLRFRLGVADLTLDPVDVDVRHQNLVVIGPSMSGRSTALETAVSGLRAGTPGVTFAGVGSLNSPLAGVPWDVAGFGRSRHLAALQEIADRVAGDEGVDVRVILAIDALEDFEGMEYNMLMEPLLRSDAVRVLAACDRPVLDRAYSGWMAELKRNRTALILQPASPADVEDLGRVRIALRPGQAFPPGRGVLAARGSATLVQVGYPA